MLSSGEFKPVWRPTFAVCLILAACLTAAKAQAGPSRGYIPTINATVTGMVFYESAREGSPRQARVYASEFSRSRARFISWELRLKHPRAGKRINFRIQARYYSPNGKLLAEQAKDTYLDPNWDTSWHTFGYGWDKPGAWAAGTYRVDLFIGNAKVASANFQIISRKGQATGQKKYPGPMADLPPDLGGL